MKKIVFASVMALASLGLFTAPMLRAQDSTITIKDPAEYNTYQSAFTQNDPKAKAVALESFLTAYPQSVVKAAVLDALIDIYQGLGDAANTLSAASRLLQVDTNNMKAIYVSVFLKKTQCGKTSDAQTCDDAAALARKGLLAAKPAGMSDADWKKQTGGAYPVFHSAIALDLAISKKDFKGAVAEYTAELMLYTDAETQSGPGLQDTLFLAKAYSQPGSKDLVKAIWFYARVWNYVPAGGKPTIEKSLEYYYKLYHGNDLKGLDDIKSQAALTTFPPGTLKIEAAKTPNQIAHDALVGGDPEKLNLGDKEYILANGSKEDADKLWTLLKDKATPVPGIVIEANASAIKVVVTQGVKPIDFIVNLTTPVTCREFPATGTDLKQQQDFILASGVKADTEKLSELFNDAKAPIKKIAIEPVVQVIKVAVAQEAKDAKTPDFIVRLKTHVSCKEAPAVLFVYGQQSKGDAELDGIYDTYTQVAATATTAQSAQIVLRDGAIVPRKTAAAHPKPAAGHPAAHRTH